MTFTETGNIAMLLELSDLVVYNDGNGKRSNSLSRNGSAIPAILAAVILAAVMAAAAVVAVRAAAAVAAVPYRDIGSEFSRRFSACDECFFVPRWGFVHLHSKVLLLSLIHI